MNKDLLRQKFLVEEYLQKDERNLSAFSFVNIFLWEDFFDFKFDIIDDNLCVFAQNEIGCFLYLPPLGETVSPKAVGECFRIMEQHNRGSSVSRIENVDDDKMKHFKHPRLMSVMKAKEYVYLRQDLVDFAGNDYKSKRSSYNQFIKNYSYEYLSFAEEMLDECMHLYGRWAEEKAKTTEDLIFLEMLKENRLVHKRAMEYFKELDLTGRVVKVEGEIKGYSFGYRLNEDVFCILFEITDLSIKGLSVFIFREFCRDEALKSYQWINVMDGCCLPNIDDVKRSFRPKKMLASHVVSKRSYL